MLQKEDMGVEFLFTLAETFFVTCGLDLPKQTKKTPMNVLPQFACTHQNNTH